MEPGCAREKLRRDVSRSEQPKDHSGAEPGEHDLHEDAERDQRSVRELTERGTARQPFDNLHGEERTDLEPGKASAERAERRRAPLVRREPLEEEECERRQRNVERELARDAEIRVARSGQEACAGLSRRIHQDVREPVS